MQPPEQTEREIAMGKQKKTIISDSVTMLMAGILIVTAAVFAQDDNSNTIVFQGKVVSEMGTPVVGAQIDIYDLLQQMQHVPYPMQHAGTATTDDQGRYSFSRNSQYFEEHVVFTVGIIQAKGYAVHRFYYPDAKMNSPIVLSSKIAAISGQVVDSQGQPVADATVAAFLSRSNRLATVDIPALKRQTDSEGRFTFDAFEVNSKMDFFVKKEGYADLYTFRTDGSWPEGTFSVGQQDVRLQLLKKASLAGKMIRRDTGQAIAGETLSIRRHQGTGNTSLYSYNIISGKITPFGSYSPHDTQTFQTDAEGCFSLDFLTPGTYTLFHHNFLKGLFSPQINVTLIEEGHRDIMFEVEAGVSVTLKGAMEDGSLPGQDVGIRLKRQASENDIKYLAFWDLGNSEKADAQGRFHFSVLPGRYEVSVSPKTMKLAEDYPVIEVPAANYPSLLFMEEKIEPPFAGVKGICINPEGLPVANAKVYLLSDPEQVVTTDAEGHFALETRPEKCKERVMWKYMENKERYETNPSLFELRLAQEFGPSYQNPDTDWMNIAAYLIAESSEGVALHQFRTHRIILNPVDPVQVTLTLRPGCSISGRAVTIDQQPVEGAKFEVIMTDEHFRREVHYKQTVSDVNGDFTVSGLAMKNNYQVLVTTGEGAVHMKHFSAALTQHSVAKGVTHVFTRETGLSNMEHFVMDTTTYSVSGVVVNHLGLPIENALVLLSAPAQGLNNISYYTEKGGRFEFEGLLAGPVQLECKSGGSGYRTIATSAGARDIRIVIEKGVAAEDIGEKPVPGAAVEMTFVDAATGEPLMLPEAYIGINQENGNSFTMPLDDKGSTRFMVNPGEVQFDFYDSSEHYESLKKKFNAAVYEVYRFRHEVSMTDTQKARVEAGPVVYPEVLSETDKVWNLKTSSGSSTSHKLLEILVKDQEMNAPVCGAEVLISFRNGQGRFIGTTNEKGKIMFAVFDDIIDCVMTSIRCPGYIESIPNRKISTFYSELTKSTFYIEQETTHIQVTVLDKEGNPAPKVWLYHAYFNGDKWGVWLNSSNQATDENGQVSMRWIYEKGPNPQIEHFISSYYIHEGFIAQVVTAMPGSEIVLHLMPAVQVQGRIVDSDGRPIAQQSINFDYRVNGKTIGGPYAKSRDDGTFGPLPIAPGFDYQICISKDQCGVFGENEYISIDDRYPVVQLPDSIFYGNRPRN